MKSPLKLLDEALYYLTVGILAVCAGFFILVTQPPLKEPEVEPCKSE